MKFKIKQWTKKDNSSPEAKIALRKWLFQYIPFPVNVLDIYGANGLMFSKVWKDNSFAYQMINKEDALSWIGEQKNLDQNVFDVDPYASPFEAIKAISEKATPNLIGLACTDGSLRRCAMMRTRISKNIQILTGWNERDLALMAAIYYNYPSYLRYVLHCILRNQWKIEKLAIKYPSGTWKQGTAYFAAILIKNLFVEGAPCSLDSVPISNESHPLQSTTGGSRCGKRRLV